MQPEHLPFGGGAAETLIGPVAAVYLLIACVLILILPRGKTIAPFLLAFFTIPLGQVVVLGGMHFTALRVLILTGLARMASSLVSSSGDKFPGGFNALDRVVVLWTLSTEVVFCLNWFQTQAFIRAGGDLVDILGGYLLVRFLITDDQVVHRMVKTLAAICVINGVCMINEQISHINVFGLLGGISREVVVRDGHIRSEGVMGCIYAGAFAGVLIPLFFWLWKEGKSRMFAFVGFAGAMAMVITSRSSTSLMAFFGSVVGLAFWPLRKSMRLVRLGLTGILVGLHLAMKAPVWALIARIDLTGSSSGDHRYHIMDMTIRHFGDWWLLGYKHPGDWGWDAWDLCNQFVAVAISGGLVTLVLYLIIFKRGFAAIGMARKQVEGDRSQEWFLWCLGSALFATVVAHFGINYMQQLLMGFFPLLACISVATFGTSRAEVQIAETRRNLLYNPRGILHTGGPSLRPATQKGGKTSQRAVKGAVY